MKTSAMKTQRQSGFSMMEILVTLVIVATALLGTAGLQAYALKTNVGSQFRNQAIFLSADIVERMEANRDVAFNGGYTLAGGGVGGNAAVCDVVTCNGAALAAYDLVQWQANVAASLPQGNAVINFVPAAPPALATYTITISWVDRATNQNSAGAAVAATAGGENFSVLSMKMIRSNI